MTGDTHNGAVMLSRREWIGVTVGAGAALALHPRLLRALQQGQLIQRAVPSTGELLPVKVPFVTVTGLE